MNRATPPPPPGAVPPGTAQGDGLKIATRTLPVGTDGNGHMIDLSADASRLLKSVGMSEGQVTLFVPGSTAAVTTIEFEQGLKQDLPAAMERVAPVDETYRHNEAWHDGNGHSHVRASLMGPSLVVPFTGGRLMLGTWQQIVLCDWDNRPRNREVILQFIGK
ncbi:MAG: hypothetical protein MAG453_01193 [Calditrichaeota bacterium]|nr:hypothetical protein [Calditrichota bacterium]